MWLQFFLENAHFAINLLAALVMFAVFWLYFDAFLGRKNIREGLKIFGFLLLSISFVAQAAFIENTVLVSSIYTTQVIQLIIDITRIIGYVSLIISQIIDPLIPQPKVNAMFASVMIPGIAVSLADGLLLLNPVLAAAVGLLYWRRATIGLENHQKPISIAFFILSIAELLTTARIWHQSTNIDVYTLVAPFSPLWIVQHIVLLLAVLVLGRWVFGYLLKRLQSQLFMIYTTSIVAIFLVTTMTFTALLLSNLQNQSLKELEKNVKVLNFAIESKKAEALSDAQVIAQNPQIHTELLDTTRTASASALSTITQNYLLTKKQSFLVVTNENGQVVARAEDKERIGDSLSDDPLIKRALLGESIASVETKAGVLAPEVSVRAATPIKFNDKTLGAVLTGTLIDTAFVDGVRNATNLETAVYGDNQLSATTMVSADGKSRAIGIKEEHTPIKNNVLTKGESYTGSVTILNKPFYAAYLPLKDVDKNPVGMLFVGNPQITVLQTAGRSIELTFLVTALLLVISILPAYFIARYIAKQIK